MRFIDIISISEPQAKPPVFFLFRTLGDSVHSLYSPQNVVLCGHTGYIPVAKSDKFQSFAKQNFTKIIETMCVNHASKYTSTVDADMFWHFELIPNQVALLVFPFYRQLSTRYLLASG